MRNAVAIQYEQDVKRKRKSSPRPIRQARKTKIPLKSAKPSYVKVKRLQPIIAQINRFCVGDERYKQVENVWHHNVLELTTEERLALRVTTLQSKRQYREQYKFLKQNR